MLFHLPFEIDVVMRHPLMLLVAVTIPLLWIIALGEAHARKYALRDPWIALHVASAYLSSSKLRILWWIGASAMFAFLVGALATPERKIITWRDIYGTVAMTFLIDTSLSTTWAEDVAPNRMVAEKEMIEDMVNMLSFDRELTGSYAVALIPFAGAAQPFYSPFTTSREQTLSDLAALNERTITKKGTSIWAALRAYDELLLWRPLHEKGAVNVAIMMSDGGKEEGKGSERSLLPSLIKELRDPHRVLVRLADIPIITKSPDINRRIIINTIGIGGMTLDQAGNRIPVSVPLIIRDKAGNFVDYYRENEKDPRSPVFRSQLDEDILRNIAAMGGGTYIHFSEKEKILQEFKELVLRYRQKTRVVPEVRYDSLRVWFLIPAFCIGAVLFGYAHACVRIVKEAVIIIYGAFKAVVMACMRRKATTKEVV